MLSKPENFTIERTAKKLWGKLNSHTLTPSKELLTHMLETGTTAKKLLTEGCLHSLFLQLQELTGIKDEQSLVTQISAICSLHDIGKAHPVFQGKDMYAQTYLENINLSQMEGFGKPLRHELVSERITKKLLANDGANERNREYIPQIISIHHQKEHIDIESQNVEIHPAVASKWNDIHVFIWTQIKAVFHVEKIDIFTEANEQHSFAIANAIAGIMITADWISSNDTVFDNQSIFDFGSVEGFIQEKEQQLLRFLQKEYLMNYPIPETKDFYSMFPQIKTMGAMQEKIYDILSEHTNISLMLIESPCGTGKTEAAFYAAAKLGFAKKKNGIYVGLPTGAAAEALQQRFDGFLRNISLPTSKLFAARSCTLRDESEAPSFTDISRQKLLYPSAVGTIDQILTVARKVRFESVRFAGLSGKVLVIDEVHAYDVYMLETICELLQICHELNVPVIMLSATLPVEMKNQLFSQALGKRSSEIHLHAAYPMITYLTDEGEINETQISLTSVDKQVPYEVLAIMNDYEKIAKKVIKNIEPGGCQCVIMNTVQEAIDVYDEIKKEIQKETSAFDAEKCELILYHARMPEETREEKTKELLKKFGKEKKFENRPKRAVVVGTQTLEQSLDVDFDYMMTSICPADLLLQREGRHQRHADEGTIRTERETGVSFQILVPNGDRYGPSERIYEKCYLDATKEAIKNKEKKFFSLPSEIPELVNHVYSCMDAKTETKNNRKKYQSNEGNLSMLYTERRAGMRYNQAFQIYESYRNGEIHDRYLSVRQNECRYAAVCLLPERMYENIEKENEKELIKKYTVKIREPLLEEFLELPHYGPDKKEEEKSEIKRKKVLRDVYIFNQEEAETENAKMVLDQEYGLRILKKNEKKSAKIFRN